MCFDERASAIVGPFYDRGALFISQGNVPWGLHVEGLRRDQSTIKDPCHIALPASDKKGELLVGTLAEVARERIHCVGQKDQLI
jgi:hypothetical protein